jgi:signal transduction histidine kinase
MTGIANVIEWAQLVEWTLLALAAANVWRRHRTSSATWLALTFSALALVVIVGRLLPEDQSEPTIVLRLLLVVLALFPYLLYRFVTSMVERRRWAWVAAHVLTAALIIWMLIIPSLPQPGEPRTGAFIVFLVLFLSQWSFLLGRVAWRLWRAGAGQPSVARKRMRTMALAASILAAVLVSSSAESDDETQASNVATSALGLLAAPLFFIGFDPPKFLRLLWRQREDAALRTAEVNLVQATSREDVANAWLPRVSELVGGEGAVLFDVDGSVLAIHKFSSADIEAARQLVSEDDPRYDAVERGAHRVLAMRNGTLVVGTGPLTPFFGEDELRMLASSSVVADLSLGRARLFELEREAGDAMRDFVAIASHDLRTPVTVIAGFTELMQDQWDTVTDEQKQEFLGAIARQVHHLDRLIGDLLTVSKLDVRELDVFRQPVDVRDVVQTVVGELDVDVTVRDPSGGSVRAFADPDHLSRMVRNYLANAVTYGSPPYSLDIALEDGDVIVCVRDAGQGVPDEFAPRLFEKFARADKKKSKSVHGTGLGLSIVRGLARSNGGDAWYERNQPVGACFCFKVPTSDSDIKSAHA